MNESLCCGGTDQQMLVLLSPLGSMCLLPTKASKMAMLCVAGVMTFGGIQVLGILQKRFSRQSSCYADVNCPSP